MSTEIQSSLISASPDENNLFVDVLHETPLSGHRKPTSLIGSIFYCFLLSGFAILAVGATWIFHPIEGLVFPLLCSCNVALLVVTGVLYFQPETEAHYSPTICYNRVWIIMLTEVVCAGSFITVYIGCVRQYNSLDSQPDVLKSLYSPLQPSSSLEGLRYQDGGRLSDQQMALLQYQQENIHFLSEEILRLQETLSKYERSNDGSAPQVDLAHLLATRDQELRTLKAEMNHLQSELRLARSIIEEKDAEIRHANNQYVEENERLRAILGEWSSRAAKLERALEMEKMSNLELQKKLTTLKTQTRE